MSELIIRLYGPSPLQNSIMDLFSNTPNSTRPLAEEMRPLSLTQFKGQKHIVGEGKLLHLLMQKDQIPSMIFWGPPGVGKTTLAQIIAGQTKHQFLTLSATQAGVQDVRNVVQKAQESATLYGRKTILFIDEIHRWNKAQQDALLPHVEKGTLTLIGATTENPSFELNGALLSRCQVVVLESLQNQDLLEIAQNAISKKQPGKMFNAEILHYMVENCYGDARFLLNLVQDLLTLFPDANQATLNEVAEKLTKRSLSYDKNAEHHYNVISAFIKSLRGSDPDASLYYLARMYEAGEDPLFLARRMIIFASEDIGNANPQAVQVAVACMQSYDFIGKAQGWIPLAQCATFLACSPKSNASYMGYQKAKADVEKFGALEVPLHLRNAPTHLMKDLGYGQDYKYAHDFQNNVVEQQHLPDTIKNQKYYLPTENGHEKKLKEWLLQKQQRS